MASDGALPEVLCPGCAGAGGRRCVLHAPLFGEMDDLPGVPAGARPRVHETPPALPHRRPRRPPLTDRVEQLEQLLHQVLGQSGILSTS